MSTAKGLPVAANIPELRVNIEGLKAHSALCVFGFESQPITNEERKLRGWLLHTIASAARHYSKMRELVYLQNHASYQDGGTVFYILDVAEQLEDSVMATHRFCSALRRMKSSKTAEEFTIKKQNAISGLASVRNQFEHMHTQIVSGETGGGPVSIQLDDEGKTVRFRKLKFETRKLHDLIEGAFYVIAKSYPDFNANSAPEPQGPLKLTMTASFTPTENSSLQERK